MLRPRKSSGRPSATVTDATPLAFARLSRTLRIRKPAFVIRSGVELQRRGVQQVGCESEVGGGGGADAIERDAAHHDQGHRDRDLQRRGHAMNAAHAEPADAGIVLQGRDDHRATEAKRPATIRTPGWSGGRVPTQNRDDRTDPLSAPLVPEAEAGRSVNQDTHRRNVEQAQATRGSPPRPASDDRFGQQILDQLPPASRRSPGGWTVPARASRCEPASCRRYSGTRPASTIPVSVSPTA